MTDTALGVEQTITVEHGELGYWERGSGPPVVFLHGLLVNANLWRKVVPDVAAAGLRCVCLDLPLGAHARPLRPGADLSPTGVADLIADALDALDLDDVTLVANDTAGALTQILMTRRPERVGRVVLSNCDALERFFPPQFQYLTKLVRVPGVVWLLSRLIQSRLLRRSPLTFGWLAKRPIEVVDTYVRPSYRDAGVRRDLRAFVRQVHPRYTLAAAERLAAFDKPVLLAWAREDRLFPLSLAHRLAAALPTATVVPIEDSYTFVPEDQPEVLARLITEFAGRE